jgi:hypothetical protein
LVDLKLVACSKLGTSFPRSRTPDLMELKLRLPTASWSQLPLLQNTKGKNVDLINLKLVAYSKLGTSFPRSRTPRVRMLT